VTRIKSILITTAGLAGSSGEVHWDQGFRVVDVSPGGAADHSEPSED
jgi:hypothetical protein